MIFAAVFVHAQINELVLGLHRAAQDTSTRKNKPDSLHPVSTDPVTVSGSQAPRSEKQPSQAGRIEHQSTQRTPGFSFGSIL